MLSDSMVQKKGYEALLKELGDIDIDHFISMAIKEPQDYTEWRSKNLNQDIAPGHFLIFKKFWYYQNVKNYLELGLIDGYIDNDGKIILWFKWRQHPWINYL